MNPIKQPVFWTIAYGLVMMFSFLKGEKLTLSKTRPFKSMDLKSLYTSFQKHLLN